MNIEKMPVNIKNDIKTATELLKKEGCKSVYIFGSLVTGKYHDHSDIDLGISGLPASRFFKVYSLLNQNLKSGFDLVDFDEKRELYDLLNGLGEIVEIN